MSGTRNHATDLFRCMLMIMIVIHHAVVHGLGLRALETGEGINSQYGFSLFLLNSCCIIAVNAFFFISGYYSIKLNPKKLIVLLLQMQFYSLCWYFIMLCSGQFSFLSGASVSAMIKVIIPFSSYWFMGVYFLLCLFAPYVNAFVWSLSKPKQKMLLILLSLVAVIYGFIFNWVGIGRGYTFVHGLYMYFIGMLCSQNKESLPFRKQQYVIIYAVLSLIVGGIAFLLYRFSHFRAAFVFYSYNNPLIIISAVSLSLCFVLYGSGSEKLRFFSKLSKYSLAVYLITDYNYARSVVFYPLKQLITVDSSQLVIAAVIILHAIVLFSVCIVIDVIRKMLFSIINKLFHLEKFYENIGNRCRRAARL